MKNSNIPKRAGLAAAGVFAALIATTPLAQAEPVDPNLQAEVLVPAPADATAPTISKGQKIRIKGIVTRRDADTFTVR